MRTERSLEEGLPKTGMGSINVVEACLVENYDDKWIIDSGATNHACYSLQWFKQSSPLSKGKRSLKLGNGGICLRNGSRTSGVMF